ncbi:MAG: heavy metal translocating P-type ATPase [Lachnospiraceae bacterium]|nr:heavy metal translocating P-type ATPase [Lachnospiraceae bacterium]
MTTKKYRLENLGCAHCAGKMEDKINRLDGIESAAISYPLKQLNVTAENPDAFLEKIQEICSSIESQVVVVPKDSKKHSHTHEHHEHDDHCDCGCEHEHHHHEHHEHDDHCDCGCEHEHHHAITKKYTLENLGCAHCAGKMEDKINQVDGVESAAISYPLKQLNLTAKDPDSLLETIQEICSSIESQVVVVPKDTKKHSHTHEHHEHDEHCDCGCEHDHNHHEHEHHHEHGNTTATVKKEKRSFDQSQIRFIIGVVFGVIATVLNHTNSDANIILIAYLCSYVFLAKEIIQESLHHIGKGQLFDENFLMTIATVGALLIGEYPEAIGVILFYRIGEAFEDYAVEKSRASIMETVNMRPETVLIVHGDHTHEIPAEDARPGQIILIRPGDRIPLDGVVVDGNTQIDTSALTGEPVPVTAHKGDEILSGCVNQTGVIKLKVTKALDESMVTRIMESMENATINKPKIDRFITRFARVYTPFVVFVAIATAVIPSILTGEWEHWIYTALTFLVISCPCALVLSIPLAFFSGIGLGSRQGILFKGGASLEVLKDIKAVVMDKTGTITEGNFILQSVKAYHQASEEELLGYAAACEQNSTHPIAKSILTAAKEKEISIPNASKIEEIAGHGIHAVIDNKEILCGNHKLMDRYQITLPEMETVYGTEILLAIDGEFAGCFLISDTIKDDSKESIAKLNHSSIQTVMLTGDSEDSAKAIANETGIKEYFAKLLPNDKLDLLQKLRKQYGPVMFVGDGINDAPVLAGADCGAAMGSGADAAIEAADVVFMTSKLSAIPEAIRIAKKANSVAVQNIVFALAVKAIFLILGLLGFASMWMAVFADTGVAVICIINSVRILRK